MRRRASARVLVVDRSNRVLLFRFVHKNGALAGQSYWATPGGAVETGESFEAAARRELFEETGIRVGDVGQPVAEQEFVLPLSDGERVLAHERFFLVRAGDQAVSRDQWTAEEIEVIAEHRWWSVDELTSTDEVVFPSSLAALLDDVGQW